MWRREYFPAVSARPRWVGVWQETQIQPAELEGDKRGVRERESAETSLCETRENSQNIHSSERNVRRTLCFRKPSLHYISAHALLKICSFQIKSNLADILLLYTFCKTFSLRRQRLNILDHSRPPVPLNILWILKSTWNPVFSPLLHISKRKEIQREYQLWRVDVTSYTMECRMDVVTMTSMGHESRFTEETSYYIFMNNYKDNVSSFKSSHRWIRHNTACNVHLENK